MRVHGYLDLGYFANYKEELDGLDVSLADTMNDDSSEKPRYGVIPH